MCLGICYFVVYIMEVVDDIFYCLVDIEDLVEKGIFDIC